MTMKHIPGCPCCPGSRSSSSISGSFGSSISSQYGSSLSSSSSSVSSSTLPSSASLSLSSGAGSSASTSLGLSGSVTVSSAGSTVEPQPTDCRCASAPGLAGEFDGQLFYNACYRASDLGVQCQLTCISQWDASLQVWVLLSDCYGNPV